VFLEEFLIRMMNKMKTWGILVRSSKEIRWRPALALTPRWIRRRPHLQGAALLRLEQISWRRVEGQET
jgi:hypothetical protein